MDWIKGMKPQFPRTVVRSTSSERIQTHKTRVIILFVTV